jgi:hypothetical protein
MGDVVFICPLPEKVLPDGTRPGPCHIYGSCTDLNVCERSGRCHFGIPVRGETTTESEAT